MIPLLSARIPPTAADAVKGVLDSGYVGGGSPLVGRFEGGLAAALGVPAERVVTMNSGTAALALALRLVGVDGARVVTTPMTFIATTTAIYEAGGRPIWADVVPGTCQIDAADVAIQARPVHAEAIMAVAWAGCLPDLVALRAVADARDRPLVLDAAQAFGACYAGRPAHEYADFTIYSFAPTKHLTTGDGGALVCRDAAEAKRARRLAWFGMRRELREGERFASDQDIPEAGFKAHMNALAAALGIEGLREAARTLDACRANAAIYREVLLGRVLVEPLLGPQVPSPYTFTIFVDDPPRFTSYMESKGVQAAQPHRRNDTNAFIGIHRRDLPCTDFAQRHYVSLPVGWWIDPPAVHRIAEAVLTYPGEPPPVPRSGS